MRGAECWNDHRLVRTSLPIRIRPPARKQKPQRRLNVSGLGRSADLSSLRAVISSNIAQASDCSPLPFQSSSDATKQWDTLSKAVMDVPLNSETPTQLNSNADGPCSVHNCKNDCAKWRTRGSPRLPKYKTMQMQIWRISFMRQ